MKEITERLRVVLKWCRKRKLEYPANWSAWAMLSEAEREKDKAWYRARRRSDVKFRLNGIMSSRIRHALKRGGKGWRHWEYLVGYSLEELRWQLEKTMCNGYIWEDFLSGKLHIDHRVPVVAFNFTSVEHIDFRRCWSLNNLRLLPKQENLKKGRKLEDHFQPSLKM